MKPLALFFLAFTGILFFCQFQFIEEETSAASYFQLINTGNRNLYSGNLKEALQNYLKAFETENHHFFHDFQKALIISHKLGKTNIKLDLLKKIAAEKKIDRYTFMNSFKALDFFSDAELLLICQFQNHNKEKNKRLYNIYYDIERFSLAKSNKDFQYENEDFLDTMSWNPFVKYRDSIYEELAEEFIAFCSKYGPPSEGNLGRSTFCTVNDDKDLSSLNLVQSILRTLWKTNHREQIDSILRKATLNGSYHPSAYALTREFTYLGRDSQKSYAAATEFLNVTAIISMDIYYIPFIHYSDSIMAAIDYRRNSIGLDSFKYAQRQVVATRICKDSLGSTPMISIYPFAQFNEYGLGFIKYALEREGLDVNEQLRFHRINTKKIKKECSCENLSY